jgi:dephospho-CoA kinase
VKTIGVTGGIGSGKSAVVAALAKRGATVIDADRVGHSVYEPGTPGWQQVVAAFGREIVAADGTIDRKRLGARVFGDARELARLNAIVHPLIRAAVAQQVAAARGGTQPVIVEAALLIEAKWHDLVDEVWLVVAAPAVIEARLVDQRGMDRAAIAARVQAQLSDAERVAHATLTIDNSGSREALDEQVARLWRERLAPS